MHDVPFCVTYRRRRLCPDRLDASPAPLTRGGLLLDISVRKSLVQQTDGNLLAIDNKT